MHDRQSDSLRVLMQPRRPYIVPFGLRRFLLGAISALCASLPVLARAADDAPKDGHAPLNKAQCEAAFEEAQRLRNSFQYIEATSEALRCANPECGAVLSDECGKLYSESYAATPSVVLGARAQDGSELGTVAIDLDGGARSVPLDGRPLLLDPGNHEFTFTADGFESTKQTVVILAGERLRSITGVLKREGGPVGSTASEAPAPGPPKKTAPADARHVPLASYVLGGIGVAGFAGFVAFRLIGAHDYDALDRECKPTCSQSSVASARQKYVVSYVGLAVGGVASLAAVTVYLASPRSPSQAAALQVRQQANGMSAHLTVPF